MSSRNGNCVRRVEEPAPMPEEEEDAPALPLLPPGPVSQWCRYVELTVLVWLCCSMLYCGCQMGQTVERVERLRQAVQGEEQKVRQDRERELQRLMRLGQLSDAVLRDLSRIRTIQGDVLNGAKR